MLPSDVDEYSAYLAALPPAAPYLTAEEEATLSERIQGGDTSAITMLVERNIPLVVWWAHRLCVCYHQTDLLLDATQEGFLGAYHAAELYQAPNGRFTTYASWWIRHTIDRFLMRNRYLPYIPINQQERITRYRKTKTRLLRETGSYTLEAIAIETGIPLTEIQQWEHMLGRNIYLSEQLNDAQSPDADRSLADTVCDPDAPEPDETFDTRATIRVLLRAILTEREYAVILSRYADTDRTFEAIGRQLHLSRERVRQLERSALQKIRADPRLEQLYREDIA